MGRTRAGNTQIDAGEWKFDYLLFSGYKEVMASKEEIRERIIDAAAERLAHFGYTKTCMAEIADDCDMSPGNLYRYFDNKLDICECIVRRATEERLAELREILRQPGLSASQCLKTYILEEMDKTYKKFERYPTLVEQTTRELITQRPLLMNEFLAASRALLAEILSMGNANGEFVVEDVVTTAEMIQSATMKFRYPQLHSSLDLENLEREARGVIRLLIGGLTKH